MGTLRIRVFGTLSLERDGSPLSQFPSSRIRDLLGYLVVNRHEVHSREYLAGILWGHLDDRRARRCLNTALWRLHRVLAPEGWRKAPYLHVDSQNIGFNNQSDVQIDLADFEQFYRWAGQAGPPNIEQQAQLYQRAVSIYGGQLLPECYEDWCLIERERIRNQYLHALNCLLAFHSSRGDFKEATEHARRMLVEDPLQEHVHRQLMDLFITANRPAAALRQYHECEQILQRELGIQPMEETQSRLRSILRHAQIYDKCSHGSNNGDIDYNAQIGGIPRLSSSLDELSARISAFDRAYSDLRTALSNVEKIASTLQRHATNDVTLCDDQYRAAQQIHSATKDLDSFMGSLESSSTKTVQDSTHYNP